MIARCCRAAASLMVAVALTGCGGGQLTNSGAGQDQQTRAFLAAYSSAGAVRCSIPADAKAIRANLLEFEQRQGHGGAILASSGEIYDRTLGMAAQQLQTSKDYCTPEKIAMLKGDLARYNAKDFSLQKPAAGKS